MRSLLETVDSRRLDLLFLTVMVSTVQLGQRRQNLNYIYFLLETFGQRSVFVAEIFERLKVVLGSPFL